MVGFFKRVVWGQLPIIKNKTQATAPNTKSTVEVEAFFFLIDII